MSQRVAAHRKRKGSVTTDVDSQSRSHGSGSSRLSGAAARVAARYATAPSYSELFAREDRAREIQPRERRSRSAEAEPAKQIMLLDLEPAGTGISFEQTAQISVAVEQPRASVAEAAVVVEAAPVFDADRGFGDDRAVSLQHPLSEALKRESRRGGWVSDGHASEMAGAQLEPLKDPWLEEEARWSGAAANANAEAADIYLVDAQPIHGNLLEFPLELIAARKVRPRRAEGVYGSAAEAEPQLSIFEVDPASVSTRPDVLEQPAETSAWSGPEWADLKLEARQSQESAAGSVAVAEESASKAVELQAAPMNLRVLAAVVDFALVSIAFLTVAILVVLKASVLPTLHEAEIGGGLVFAAIAFVYLAVSYMLARVTPGMRYALISLRTFDGQPPTREQRCRRLGALAVSMLPVGLGAIWALFDEQHLSWHDRWSGTYLRRV